MITLESVCQAVRLMQLFPQTFSASMRTLTHSKEVELFVSSGKLFKINNNNYQLAAFKIICNFENVYISHNINFTWFKNLRVT